MKGPFWRADTWRKRTVHDIKWIRENPDAFDKAMVRRGLAPISQEILTHDLETRNAKTRLQELQQQSNELAKKIGELKARKQNADAEITQSKTLKAEIAALKEKEQQQPEEISALDALLAILPNILSDDVPDGAGPEDNVEIRQWGERPQFDFDAREHFDLGEALGYMDFEQTAKLSGARFSTLKGPLARLERALAHFMLDVHTKEFGYTEVSPPYMVREQALFGTSQLPKFAEDLFKTTTDHWLIPTAEVPLTNLVHEKILEEKELPLRLTAYTPCFRAEAGAAGKDTRGLIRQHQFSKVELVSVTTPEQAEDEHERLTRAAEEILKRLELPYRVMLLCSTDTGFGSRKTYDIEVWLPGQLHYREISSCSHFGDFQARRMKARHRRADEEKGTHFVHTLNGSGLAVGRTIVAVMENYQNVDGTITIPKSLRPYMDGETTIR